MESKKRIGTPVVFNIDDTLELMTSGYLLDTLRCFTLPACSPSALLQFSTGWRWDSLRVICVQSRKERTPAHCLRHQAYTSAFIASINIHPSVSKGISNNTSDTKSSSIFSIDNRATNFIHTKLCKLVYWIMIYTEERSLILKTLYVERRNIHHFLIACQRFSSARW